MPKSQTAQVVITANAATAKKVLDELKRKAADCKNQMQQLANAGKQNTKAFKDAQKQFAAYNAAIVQNISNTQRVDHVMKHLSTTTTRDLKRALGAAKKELEGMTAQDPRLRQMQKSMAAIKAQIDKNTGAIKQQAGAWSTVMKNVTAYFSAFNILATIKSKLTEVYKLNLQFSDQLANIRKVSGLAYKDIAQLSTSLAKIDTRTTIQELNDIAYAGAKLGIGKYGTEGLESFVRAANQVNVALKEDMGADALTALSKITEVMGDIKSMGVEKSMLATGSALFKLGATSTATAGNIVEFSKRLTGIAKTAGMTTDQLLALGSASDSMYLMPEVAATAFNKFISSLQKNHNLIEKELNIEPGTINNLYSTGKTLDAMVLVFEKMKEKGNMNALGSVFKPLGSEGARLINVMITMAQNVDMLKDHIYVAEEAFADATAVSAEYAIQQETAAALVERASNIWAKAFVNPEGVDMAKSLAQTWYDFAKFMNESAVASEPLKMALSALLGIIKALIIALPVLVNFMLFKGVAAVISGLVALYGSLAASMRMAGGAAAFLKTSMLSANGLMAIAAFMTTVISLTWDWYKASNEAGSAQKRLKQYLAEAAIELDKEERKLQGYIASLEQLNDATETRSKVLAKFNHEYAPYLNKLGIEAKSVDDIRKNYEALNAEIKKKLYYQMRERAYTDRLGDIQGKRTDAVLEYQDYIVNDSEGKQFAAYTPGYLEQMISSGKSTKDIVNNMVRGVMGPKGKWSPQGNIYNYSYKGEQQRFDANKLYDMVYEILNQTNKYNTEKNLIDSAFKDLVGDYDPNVVREPGTLDNLAPDKAAAAEAKRQHQANLEQWHQEMKDYTAQGSAVIDNINNFYIRQIDAIKRIAKDEVWDPKATDNFVNAMKARMNDMLEQARLAIVKRPNDWDTIRTTILDDLWEVDTDGNGNESTALADQINAVNVADINSNIVRLSKNLNVPETAWLDAIWKNASKNRAANADASYKHGQEVQSRRLQDNYTGKVDEEYKRGFGTLGLFAYNETEIEAMRKEPESRKVVTQDRDNAISTVLANTRANIVDLYSVSDLTDATQKDTFLRAILGGDPDEVTGKLSEVKDYTVAELDVLRSELIKYYADYTAAQKKAQERTSENIDFQWKESKQYKDNSRRQQENDTEGGKFRNRTYAPDTWLPSFGEDPEIRLYQMKMEAAKQYYDFLAARTKDETLRRQAAQKAQKAELDYTKKVAENLKSRMDEVLGLHQPIEDFGTAAGKAFATMTEDAEAGRKALKAALGDMINGFLQETMKLTQEQIRRRLMQAIHNHIMEQEAKRSADKQVDIESEKQEKLSDEQQSGGKLQRKSLKSVFSSLFSFRKKQNKKETKLEEKKVDQMNEIDTTANEASKTLNIDAAADVADAKAEISNETVQQQQAAAQESVQTQSAETQASTTMGIAEGASKIIGSLGWWGIPLVAVITALLNGLLSMAMSKVSSLFGSSDSTDSGTSSKLVSGMLTYDAGNVQSFRGIEDGKSYPVVGSDGRVYAATDGGELSTGLVSDPITTIINGQPALVAERGPEMVIGRETTAAMMMARPDLLREIVAFDRNRSGQSYRAYDAGNLAELAQSLPTASALSDAQAQALSSTLSALSDTLLALQRNGITATINKYGRGGVTEAAASGRSFMRRNSSDALWAN